MAFGGAYAIRPYRGTSKRIKFRCSYLKKGLSNGGFAPMPRPSFLSLMKEKKAKEDQGLYRGQGS